MPETLNNVEFCRLPRSWRQVVDAAAAAVAIAEVGGDAREIAYTREHLDAVLHCTRDVLAALEVGLSPDQLTAWLARSIAAYRAMGGAA